MKYRRLDNDELRELEDSFVRFLASHQLTAEDWQRLKTDQPERVDTLIEQFSDLVFERVLNEIEYLEFKSPKDIQTFHCEPDRIQLLGIRVEGISTINFTDNEQPEIMLGQLLRSGAKLKMYQGEKPYKKERNLELFEMMESGCKISKDGALFKALQALKQL